MAVTVTFSNLKGGVGKTVTVAQVAHAAVATGERVLVIDADPQGNSSRHLADVRPDDEEQPQSLADVLDRGTATPIQDVVIEHRRAGLHVVPSGFDQLQAVQDSLFGKAGGDLSLKKALAPVKDRYDLILIDTRPAMDLLTRNALMAADRAVIVFQPELDAIDGYVQTAKLIADLQEYLDKTLPIAGFIINMLDRGRKDHAEYAQTIIDIAQADNIPVLGASEAPPISRAIPMNADLARLNAVGYGLDEHPKPTARSRVLAKDFALIAQQIQKEEVPA